MWAVQRVFFGTLRETFERVRDATTLELTYLVPLVIGILLLGIRPGSLTPVVSNGLIEITSRLTGG